MLQTICLLEKAGGRVHRIVCVGANTTLTMWAKLVLTGKLRDRQNSLEHSTDPTSKVYEFSDSPPLFKSTSSSVYASGLHITNRLTARLVSHMHHNITLKLFLLKCAINVHGNTLPRFLQRQEARGTYHLWTSLLGYTPNKRKL